MFGDDTFQSKRAGVLEKLGAVTMHLLGKLYRANGSVEQVGQDPLIAPSGSSVMTPVSTALSRICWRRSAGKRRPVFTLELPAYRCCRKSAGT